MRFSASCAGMALLLFLSPAYATKVSAKFTLSKEYRDAMEAAESSQASNGKDCYWKLPNSILPTAPPKAEFGDDIVAVLMKDDAPDPKPDEVVSYNVHAGRLEKNVIVTRPGSSVKLLNVSPFNQELYSPDLSSFKPEAQSTNSFRLIDFPSEGVFEVRSKRFPHFKGYVVVTKGATVDLKDDGTMTEDLEPGKYTLKVFHDGKWVHKQSFAVEGGRMEPLTVTIKPGAEETPAAKADPAPKKEDKKPAEKPKSDKSGN